MNTLGSCVSFQIKVQILAFYMDVCTGPKEHLHFSFHGIVSIQILIDMRMYVLYPCVDQVNTYLIVGKWYQKDRKRLAAKVTVKWPFPGPPINQTASLTPTIFRLVIGF